MSEPLPCDPDEILSYEAAGSGLRVFFKDGSEKTFQGEDAERIVAVLQHVTPPNA
jgi:hypothetical protein